MPKGIRKSGAELKRLKHLGIINSLSLSKVAEELCCDTQAKACMYRECLSCKNKSLKHTTSTGTSVCGGTSGSQKKKIMKK